MIDSSEIKILIVDDESKVLYYMRCLLEREGYKVFTAQNIHSALDSFHANLPDLCIVDIYLSEFSDKESGLDFLRKVFTSGHDFKTIVISGLCGVEKIEEMEKMPIDIFLYKPLDIDQLRNTVKSLLQADNANQTNA